MFIENRKKNKDKVFIPQNSKDDSFVNTVYQKHQHIYFYDEVNPKSIQELVISLRTASLYCKNIQAELDLEEPPPIHLHIHSYGGDVYSGFSGASHIINNSVPVYTYIDGAVASAGSFLSLAGKKRFMTPLSFLLIHQVSGWYEGSFEYLKDESKNLKSVMTLLFDFYSDHTKLKKSKIEKILKRDIWFDYKKCLKFGLVDEILK